MNRNAEQTSSFMPVRSAVLVASEHTDVTELAGMFSPIGFDIAIIENFSEAKALLAVKPPDLLVTFIRLGAYNGLHLVLRGKAVHPGMAALVLSRGSDAALQADAERLGATLVVQPLSPAEIRAAVERTLYRHDGQPVRAPFERRVAERRTAALGLAAALERRTGERRGTARQAASAPTANGI